MIKLTRIDGTNIFINECNIQWLECQPDTTITFLNGSRLIIREGILEVLQQIEKVTHQSKQSDNEDFLQSSNH